MLVYLISLGDNAQCVNQGIISIRNVYHVIAMPMDQLDYPAIMRDNVNALITLMVKLATNAKKDFTISLHAKSAIVTQLE